MYVYVKSSESVVDKIRDLVEVQGMLGYEFLFSDLAEFVGESTMDTYYNNLIQSLEDGGIM